MKLHVIGGAWLTAGGRGRMESGDTPVLAPGTVALPPVEVLFETPPVRYRRFDAHTRLGCAAIAMALGDAGLDRRDRKRPIGIVAASLYECIEVDLDFYETTREDGGLYASPNLFSYTLPGIVAGEAAIHFQLTGPTFTVGEWPGARGMAAVTTSADLIASGACPAMVCGWIESDTRRLRQQAAEDDGIRGAIFVVLSRDRRSPRDRWFHWNRGACTAANGEPIRDIGRFFGGLPV